MIRLKPTCPRCDSPRHAMTTMGQIGGGSLDTTNVYRCSDCVFTWKFAVVELAPPEGKPDMVWTCWVPK